MSAATTGTQVALAGPWQIERDPGNVGRDEGWYDRGPGAGSAPATVPGLIQQTFPAYHGVAWYWTTFRVPDAERYGDPAWVVLLRFDAVDYMAEVWVDGAFAGRHEGGETPFELDLTAIVRRASPGAEHRLAARVLNPIDEPIDEIILNQTPHRNKRVDYRIGWSYNRGGIVGAVTLLVAPALRVVDIFARPDVSTGEVALGITVNNPLPEAQQGCKLSVVIEPATGGNPVAGAAATLDCPPGVTTTTVQCRVPSPRLWSTTDPYLYRVHVALDSPSADTRHTFSVRFGFRSLRVEQGYFRLNGQRFFLRCSHTGNDWPSAMTPVQLADAFRCDLLYAKAAGFNCIRFIAGMATPAQLDLCDELGLMVYEEAHSSWCMEDAPYFAQRFDAANAEMIRRDRNHASIVIWGMLNETMDGPVFRHAVETLPLVRSLDPTRLVLLNTGRMDCELGIGSVSNPGSVEWEHQWGGEAPGAGRHESLREPHTFGGYPGGYFERVGDAHMYPPTPHSAETIRFLRTLGHDTKPVYIGEYGIASMVDAIRVTRLFEQAAGDAGLFEDGALYRSWAEQYASDWQRYGMDAVTAFPQDLLQESQRLHGAQRLLGLNAIRSNPRICGYNLTGTVDQGMTAEGLWSTWREFKPGVLDALADGLAPLRWCLFVEPLHAYVGSTFHLEAVLADEDVLSPADYPVTARVFGSGGCVWERRLTIHVLSPHEGTARPLTMPVLDEQVVIDGPAGTYQFGIVIDRGAAPAGGRTTFYVSDSKIDAVLPGAVTIWEDDGRLAAWLQARQVAVVPFDGALPIPDASVILVGSLPLTGMDPARWQVLERLMDRGSTVIFISPDAFLRGEDTTGWLPLVNKGRCDIFYNSIYHREDVAKNHPIFAGLPAGGIMDWAYYRDIIPQRIFQDQDTPDETIVAGFAVGYTCPTGYTSGVSLGVYRSGAGRFLVNTLRVLEHLGSHPVADRLLANMIAWAGG